MAHVITAMASYILTTMAILASGGALLAEKASITVDVDKPGIAISPHQYGIFFEEFGRGGDGGLYAEMLKNRSFEDKLDGWSLFKEQDAEGSAVLDSYKPLNANNPTAVRLEIKTTGKRVALYNQGFPNVSGNPLLTEFFDPSGKRVWSALSVVKGERYHYSLYARTENQAAGDLTVSLEKPDGTMLASAIVSGMSADWKKFEGELKSDVNEPNARLLVSARQKGTVWIDMVSLMPNYAATGLPFRKDMLEKLRAMKPGFVRFPGGSFVQGRTAGSAFQWKRTIGDLEQRKGWPGFWHYYYEAGLGYHEFLQLCEELKSTALYVAYAGTGPGHEIPMEKMGAVVQDALDAIEYAIGPVDSPYGSLRAKAGHPDPFDLQYVEIGNEDWGKRHYPRYIMMVEAIKKRYPAIKLISNTEVHRHGPCAEEIRDEHAYEGPEYFLKQAKSLDTMDRTKTPKLYWGEYGTTFQCGNGNLRAALSDAAFLVSTERNSDLVPMTSYAPLFGNALFCGWIPNPIYFDSEASIGSVTYYGQCLLGQNRADEALPVTVKTAPFTYPVPGGFVGVGARGNGVAEFKEMKVVQDGKTLFGMDIATNDAGEAVVDIQPVKGGAKSGSTTTGSAWSVDSDLIFLQKSDSVKIPVSDDPAMPLVSPSAPVDPSVRETSSRLPGWKTANGNWEGNSKILRVKDTNGTGIALTGERTLRDCIITLKARLVSGTGGILVAFRCSNPVRPAGWLIDGKQNGVNWAWWPKKWVPGGIETGRWYDLRVELKGTSIKCYIDGKLVQDITYPVSVVEPLHVCAGVDKTTKEIVLKVVNVRDEAYETAITLAGAGTVASDAKALVLTSTNPDDENTFDNPENVVPRSQTIKGVGSQFTYTFPANSVTVLRLITSPKQRK